MAEYWPYNPQTDIPGVYDTIRKYAQCSPVGILQRQDLPSWCRYEGHQWNHE